MFSYENFNKLCELPVNDQAICVYEAAKYAAPIWEATEKEREIEPFGSNLLSAFWGWLDKRISSSELKIASDRLLDILPKNLPEEKDENLRAGFAGWAVLGVATIALEEFPDVQDSIMQSSVIHAARAVAGLGRREFHESSNFLSAEEQQFLNDWWERCCTRYPQLMA